MLVKILKVNDGALLPTKVVETDACYALFVPQDTELLRGRGEVSLGFRMIVPEGLSAVIRPRREFSLFGMECEYMPEQGSFSGSKTRVDADVLESVINAGVSDEVRVVLNVRERLTDEGRVWLKQGTFFAMLQFVRVPIVDIVEVGDLDLGTMDVEF